MDFLIDFSMKNSFFFCDPSRDCFSTCLFVRRTAAYRDFCSFNSPHIGCILVCCCIHLLFRGLFFRIGSFCWNYSHNACWVHYRSFYYGRIRSTFLYLSPCKATHTFFLLCIDIARCIYFSGFKDAEETEIVSAVDTAHTYQIFPYRRLFYLDCGGVVRSWSCGSAYDIVRFWDRRAWIIYGGQITLIISVLSRYQSSPPIA